MSVQYGDRIEMSQPERDRLKCCMGCSKANTVRPKRPSCSTSRFGKCGVCSDG